MKEKVLAALMSTIMVMAALAVIVPVQAENPTPATVLIHDPAGENTALAIGIGNTITTKIDFNYKAYDAIKVGTTDYVNAKIGNSSLITNGVGTTVNLTDIKVTAAATSDPSIYTLTVEGAAETASDAATMRLITLTVRDTVTFVGSNPAITDYVDLEYIYGINVKVGSADAPTVIVKEGTTTHTGSGDSFTFYKGQDYGNAFAKVKIGSTEYESDKYDFYATGLPSGIYMKSTGEIAGKLSSDVPVSESGTDPTKFTVYAVNKASVSKTILKCEFVYTVDIDTSDAFTYQIVGNDDNPVSYSIVGYTAIKNTDGLTIKVFKANSQAIPSANYSKYKMTYYAAAIPTTVTGLTDGAFTIAANTFANDTGIVQINITDGKYNATIHVMVVGPLVHSGLDPAVQSA
ncbi:MAG: hypothetical protein IKH98_01070 [Candidatus Methanomethylophilaceae archaeon]|nr:hypothetical protein [Candidatus Methanomethylophilaceae archaeon]